MLQSDRYKKVAAEIENTDYKKQERQLQTALNLKKIIPSFGFDNLVADSFYLDFVQYFGDKTARDNTGYSLTPQYFEAIAKKDANFIQAYLTLATANSMYAGKAEETISLIDDVLEQAYSNGTN